MIIAHLHKMPCFNIFTGQFCSPTDTPAVLHLKKQNWGWLADDNGELCQIWTILLKVSLTLKELKHCTCKRGNAAVRHMLLLHCTWRSRIGGGWQMTTVIVHNLDHTAKSHNHKKIWNIIHVKSYVPMINVHAKHTIFHVQTYVVVRDNVKTRRKKWKLLILVRDLCFLFRNTCYALNM